MPQQASSCHAGAASVGAGEAQVPLAATAPNPAGSEINQGPHQNTTPAAAEQNIQGSASPSQAITAMLHTASPPGPQEAHKASGQALAYDSGAAASEALATPAATPQEAINASPGIQQLAETAPTETVTFPEPDARSEHSGLEAAVADKNTLDTPAELAQPAQKAPHLQGDADKQSTEPGAVQTQLATEQASDDAGAAAMVCSSPKPALIDSVTCISEVLALHNPQCSVSREYMCHHACRSS